MVALKYLSNFWRTKAAALAITYTKDCADS